MDKLLGWTFNHIGNLFYDLNGGLDGLDRQNLRHDLMIQAWVIAYRFYDKVTASEYFSPKEQG